jgi:hypothetical protein
MLKVLMIIVGVLVLITAAAIGGGYWWWNSSGKEFIESAGKDYDDARKAGRGMNEQACLDRSVAVVKTPDGQTISGAIRNGVALKGCLQTSRIVPPFCDGVPAKTEFVASATWEVNTCSKLGATGQFCQQLVREMATYCSGPERAAKLAKGSSGANSSNN